MVICIYCGEELEFKRDKGWVHKLGGEIYKTKIKKGKIVDDHIATPKRSQESPQPKS